jgi:hypothetical protein
MKWVFYIFAVAGLAWVGWWTWQRVFTTDEMRVQRLLDTMVLAVEHGSLIKMEDCLAGDYSDDFGLDKSGVIGALRSFRSRYDAVFVELSDQTITIDPDGQTALVVLLGKIRVRPKGELADTVWQQDHFRLHFRKTNGGWKLTRTESPELKVE